MDSEATIMGVGDLHDRTYDDYVITFSPLAGYTVQLYPSKQLYYIYVTDTPEISCLIVVLLITFTAFLVLIYGHLVKKREMKLTEAAKYSFASAAARDAVLLAKKVYVRYISHEIRTPLNAAYLGLKILEKEISKSKGPRHIEHLVTVRDVVNACDIAVGILNDLLNYDKLEDGSLGVEPRRVCALPFLISCTNLFLLPAEEKGIVVIFDIAPDCVSNNDILIIDNIDDIDAIKNKIENEIENENGVDEYGNDNYKTKSIIDKLIDNNGNGNGNGNNATYIDDGNDNNSNKNMSNKSSDKSGQLDQESHPIHSNPNSSHNSNSNSNSNSHNNFNSNPNSNSGSSYPKNCFLSPFDSINVDEHKMSQVIRNLMSNAIKVQ